MDRIAIDRRIGFLLWEAASREPIYDQSVRFTMRVISNWVSCGKDVSSSGFKKLAVYMSKNAHKLRGDLNDHKIFASQTINEHPEELRIIWDWMTEARGQISTDEALSRFKRYPVIVITKHEDDELRRRKAIGPEARYDGIELVMNQDGQWVDYKLVPFAD
jgi:hypothetical protein